MKFIWFVLGSALCFQNNVFAAACDEKFLQLNLDANADTRCSALNIPGQYYAKFCSADQGTLTSKDGISRFLFKTGETWMARRDSYDVGNGTLDSNVLNLDFSHSRFTVEQIKSKRDGTIISRYICPGTLIVSGDREMPSSNDSQWETINSSVD
jgi:hypothetical protein